MLPNLIIIGAAKSGTSSLHHYLNLHPEISMSKQKELNFFNRELGWKKGIKWYKSNFTGIAKIYGESSPSYTGYPLYKGVARRMHSVVPGAKLIYIVRDPVDRLISHYLDRVKGGQERRTIARALEGLESTDYVCVSKYFMQLKQYLKYYPKERILVLTAEELKNERHPALKRIFRFLNVDDSFYSDAFSDLKNVSAGKLKQKKPRRIIRYFMSEGPGIFQVKKIAKQLMPEPLKNRTRQLLNAGEKIDKPILDNSLKRVLCETLREDVEHLRKFTGYRFENWSL